MRCMKKQKKRRRTLSTRGIGWWKKQTQIKFNKLVTSNIGYCQWCGSQINQLQCSHVYSIGARPSLRFNILNVLCLCSYCHRFRWHDNPADAWDWYKEKFPSRYKYLQTVKNIFHKITIEECKQIQEYIKNKDFKKLLIPTT